MKSMLLYRPSKIEEKPLKLEEMPMLSPGPGELLLKVISCGVCHSNLHMIEGDWVKYGVPAKSPIVPGHEIIGRIAEIGEGVTGYRKGDLVGVQPLLSSCGRCEYCLTGREHLCAEAKITGEMVDGGYAEYVLTRAGYVYPVPENLDPVLS